MEKVYDNLHESIQKLEMCTKLLSKHQKIIDTQDFLREKDLKWFGVSKKILNRINILAETIESLINSINKK